MGADHANTLHRSVRGAEVTAVADIDLGRAKARRGPGRAAADDASALIADPAVDAVLIASHDSTHAALVVAAVRAGKPVLCEKPLAPTLAECAAGRCARAAPPAGRCCRWASCAASTPATSQLKQAIDARRRRRARARAQHQPRRQRPPRARPSESIDHGLGDPRVRRACPGCCARPSSRCVARAAPSAQVPTGLQDPQLILLRTADGVLSTGRGRSSTPRYGYDIRCEVVGETGTLSAHRDRAGGHRRRPRHGPSATPPTGGPGSPTPTGWSCRPGSTRCWPGHRRRSPPARDGVAASAVAEAVITSMHDGGRVVEVELP